MIEDEEDLELEEVEEAEDTAAYKAPFQEYDLTVLESATDAKVKISELTANEFLVEIYVAATMLRNVCGDSDGFVAEQANTIRSNVLVLANEIVRDPAELVMSVARSMDSVVDKFNFISAITDKLIAFETHLSQTMKEGTLSVSNRDSGRD